MACLHPGEYMLSNVADSTKFYQAARRMQGQKDAALVCCNVGYLPSKPSAVQPEPVQTQSSCKEAHPFVLMHIMLPVLVLLVRICQY